MDMTRPDNALLQGMGKRWFTIMIHTIASFFFPSSPPFLSFIYMIFFFSSFLLRHLTDG